MVALMDVANNHGRVARGLGRRCWGVTAGDKIVSSAGVWPCDIRVGQASLRMLGLPTAGDDSSPRRGVPFLVGVRTRVNAPRLTPPALLRRRSFDRGEKSLEGESMSMSERSRGAWQDGSLSAGRAVALERIEGASRSLSL